MPQPPFKIQLGPFSNGLNTAVDKGLVSPEYAVIARGVDVADGTLRGAFTEGAEVDRYGDSMYSPFPTGQKFFWFTRVLGWIFSEYPDYGCNNDSLFTGMWAATPSHRHYTTQKTGDQEASWPWYYVRNSQFRLGMRSQHDVTPGASSATTRGLRTYAVTLYQPVTALESNPTQRTASVKSGASLTGLPTAPTDGSEWSQTYVGNIWRRIYATREGDPNGDLYYYDTITNNTATTYTDTGGRTNDGGLDLPFHPVAYDVDDTMRLNWGYGGSIDNEAMLYDHAPAPNLTVMAEDLMSIGDDGDAGVLFGAEKSIIRWSHIGKQWAWPEIFQHNLNDYCEALVYWQGTMYAFTAAGVWAFSGAADFAIQPVKTGAAFGIRQGFGRTAKVTPFGIMFLAREGLALFDGASARIISASALSPSEFLPGVATYGNAAFFDGFYLLNLWGQSKVIAVDLRRGLEGMSFTQSALDPADLHVTPFVGSTAGTETPGLYVLGNTSTEIRSWRPADQSTDRYGDWQWKTGALSGGHPGKMKRLGWIRADYDLPAGSLALSITTSDDVDGTLRAHTYTTTLSSSARSVYKRLPAHVGRYITIEINADSAPDALIRGVTIEGTVYDAAA